MTTINKAETIDEIPAYLRRDYGRAPNAEPKERPLLTAGIMLVAMTLFVLLGILYAAK